MKNLEKHQIITKFVSGLEKDLANSLMIIGSAGTGKTETILSSLKELNLKENEHFRYLNNYSSPLEFYHILEKMSELEKPRILVVDDGEEIINSKRILGILRASLWAGTDNKRIVHWHSTSPKVQSQSFEFTGKVILLLNELNLKNSLVRALISRGFYFRLELSNQEKLALMRKRIKEPYKNLSFKDRQKIMNYVEEVGKYSEKLTLRILPMSYNIFLLSPNHYRTLVAEMLK